MVKNLFQTSNIQLQSMHYPQVPTKQISKKRTSSPAFGKSLLDHDIKPTPSPTKPIREVEIHISPQGILETKGDDFVNEIPGGFDEVQSD